MRAHARFARERVRPEHSARLAYHWWEALKPPDADWIWAGDAELPAMRREAFRAHLAAGDRHADHFAVDQAIELLGRAAQFASDDAERAEAERALGNAYRRVLRTDDSWTHLMLARALYGQSAPLGLYSDLLQTAQYIGAFHRPPSDQEIGAVADEGVKLARAAGDERVESQILRARASFLGNRHPGDPAVSEPFVDAAVSAAHASGDTETIRQALATKGALLRLQGRAAESLEVYRGLADLVADADALDRFNWQRFVAKNEFLAGDLAAAERASATACALAESMGPHNRTHAWQDPSEIGFARGDWQAVIELAQRTARLVQEEKASAFCRSAAGIIAQGASAHALAGQRDEAMALLRAIPTSDIIDKDLTSGLPLALLGFAAPATDEKLRAAKQAWWEWAEATMRAVVLGRPDDAENALREMGRIVETSPVYGALAEGVREAVAELRGGPAPTFAALRKLGLNGWVEVLQRRVDAGY
jgi:tetratricopeptide (TPR) repeat protein